MWALFRGNGATITGEVWNRGGDVGNAVQGTLVLGMRAREPKSVISGTRGHTGTPNFQAWLNVKLQAWIKILNKNNIEERQEIFKKI